MSGNPYTPGAKFISGEIRISRTEKGCPHEYQITERRYVSHGYDDQFLTWLPEGGPWAFEVSDYSVVIVSGKTEDMYRLMDDGGLNPGAPYHWSRVWRGVSDDVGPSGRSTCRITNEKPKASWARRLLGISNDRTEAKH